MRRILVVLALVFGLALATVPAASPANAWGTHSSSTSTGLSQSQTAALQWISDNVNLTQTLSHLSPGMKSLVNTLLKLIGPALCPALAKAASPDFQAFVSDFCTQMVASADPLGQMLQFLPLLCSPGVGELVFPSFQSILPLLCGILT